MEESIGERECKKFVEGLKTGAHERTCLICMEVKTTTCSREALGRFLKEEEEDGEFDRFSDWTFTVHLQYSKHIFS